MTKGTLYTLLGVFGLGSIAVIWWRIKSPTKPNTAAANASDNLVNNPTANAPASGTPAPGSNTNTGMNASTPAASTNLGYTVVDASKWGAVKVGDKLNAESETALYLKPVGSADNSPVYYVKKGDYVGQILTITTQNITVRNWKIPDYTDEDITATIFYIPGKVYRKQTT